MGIAKLKFGLLPRYLSEKLYNITLKGVPDQHPIGHLIFAEGLVVGDNVYQSGILEDILGELC